MLSSATIMGVLRHILTIVGGYLAAKFAIQSNVMDAGIAAIVSLVGIVWSIVSKTPYVADSAPAALAGSSVPGGVEAAPAALLGDPAAYVARIKAPVAPHGLRKDGKPRAKPGRKPKK